MVIICSIFLRYNFNLFMFKMLSVMFHKLKAVCSDEGMYCMIYGNTFVQIESLRVVFISTQVKSQD